MIKKTLFTVIAVLFALTAFAETVIKALPVKNSDIQLDGVLNETIWQQAPRYSNFSRFMHANVAAEESTAFQVAASAEGIYFAFDIHDRETVARITQFDGDLTKFDDVIELFISADDPLPDDANVRIARQLIFNFRGTRADGSYLAGVRDSTWTSDWQAAVKKSDKGITAEVFVPYYAFDFVNAKNKRFRFNIGREHIDFNGKKSISVWQSTSRFMDMSKFAVLEVPFKDFEQYQWQISDLELKTVPVSTGSQQVLTGKLTGNISDILTLQASARSNGKLVVFNRSRQQVKSSQTVSFSMPLEVGKSGKYLITLTGRTGNGKKFYTCKELQMQSTCFTMKIAYPIYRKSIFPDQENKTLKVEVDYAAAPGLLADVKTIFEVKNSAGKVIATHVVSSGSVRTFSVDAAAWQPGKYTVAVKSEGPEFAQGLLSDTISVIAPAKPGSSSVRLNDDRYLVVNGKPFFPRGFIGGQHREPHFFDGMQAAGFNTVQFYGLNWPSLEDIKIVLDKAHKCNLKVFCYPYWGTSIGFTGFRDLKVSNKYRKPRLTDAQWERLKKMVAQVKDHPAFLGWYLADEPRGGEMIDELKKVYALLKEMDPHHPVIHLDFTANGCIAKKDGLADIHILDMYPHPLKDGSWFRPLPSVFYSMKLVHENIGSAGSWFCPEAFTPRGAKYRPMTYRELRCLVFGTIVNGATGMMPYKIGSTSQTYYIHARNSGIFYTPEMRLGYLEGLGPELNALDGVLTAPEKLPIKAQANNAIHVMRKKYRGKEFIFAVNALGQSCKSSFTASGLAGDKLQVLSENRTVSVKNGVFEDSFEPFAVHIYTNDKNFTTPVNVKALEEKIRKVDLEARKNLKKIIIK